ncbi:MAG: hypothetical protein IJ092_06255, partial [Atopobiaceae bacterium]|nr:hypothetical protein [Atopobiaceae bacterium]
MANGLAKSIREYVDAKLEKALRSQTVKRMAEVTRVSDDGTVWVSYPGGETESPASTLSSVREGDTVSVEISRGRATVTGNLSDPSAGSASVVGVEEKTVKVNRALETYKEVTTDKLAATDAKIVNIEADTAKVHDLTADSLAAATGYIADLSAGEVTAQDIIADKAKLAQVDVGQITADHATVERLDADHVTVSDFQAEQAKVGQLQADTADLGAIRANSAKVKDLTADQLATA